MLGKKSGDDSSPSLIRAPEKEEAVELGVGKVRIQQSKPFRNKDAKPVHAIADGATINCPTADAVITATRWDGADPLNPVGRVRNLEVHGIVRPVPGANQLPVVRCYPNHGLGSK